MQNGFSVAFMSADHLVDVVRRDEARRRSAAAPPQVHDHRSADHRRARLPGPGPPDAHLLFKVINHRYERGSTLITSNKSIREWPEMLAGDEVLATAILDRLLHYCHVLQIDGRSFRLRDMEQQLAQDR